MKKYYFTIIALIISFAVLAQESAETMNVNDEWPLQTKQILLVLFALLCIFFAARTFRGKPDA